MAEEQETQSGLAIVPAEQKTIDFYGDDLVAVRDEEGTVWVPMRRLCEAIGVTLRGQLAKIERSPVLSDEVRSVYVTYTDGRTFAMECLPLKFVRFWLATLDTSRVKDEAREHIIRYQREVVEIIDRAFTRVPTTVAADEAHMFAMRDLARQQAVLSQQQADLWEQLITEKRRLDAVQQLSEDHEGMIADLEWQIDDLRRELAQVQTEMNQKLTAMSNKIRLLPAPSDTTISKEQQSIIQGLVGDLVAAANARGIALWQNRGGNNYQAAYATLNRTFRVPSYKDMTSEQFPKAVEWLEGEITKVEGN